MILHVGIAIHLCLSNPEAPKGKKYVSWSMLTLRGIFAAATIGATIGISSTSALAAAILSTFPVIFTTTMVALYFSQGAAVQLGCIGPLMLGSVSVGFYAVCVGLLAPVTTVPAASAISYVICVVTLPPPLLPAPCTLYIHIHQP